MKNSPSVQITNGANQTQLVVGNATRKLNGDYTLVAQNEHGRDEASVEVLVRYDNTDSFILVTFSSQVPKRRQHG